MEPDECDEDYGEEEIIEYCGLAIENAWVLKITQENWGETSIDGNNKTSRYSKRNSETKEQKIQHWSIGKVNHRPTVFSNMDKELMIPAATYYSSGKQKMNTAYTETSMDMHKRLMAESFMCLGKTSETFWKELQCMDKLIFVYQNM